MEVKEIVEINKIILSEVGSTLHGTGLDGQEDLDKMGVFIEPPKYVFGQPLEHYIYRTAGEGNRSGPDDIDLTYYSLRKYIKLATQGNPSILLLLFAPQDRLFFQSHLGEQLQALAPAIVSKKAGPKFLGYLLAQKAKLIGERGGAPKRPELVEKFGYDTKFAMHALRLGMQGIELMMHGNITLPMHGEDAQLCLDTRKGVYPLEEVVEGIEVLESTLDGLLDGDDLAVPNEPDWEQINEFLYEAHIKTWEEYLNGNN